MSASIYSIGLEKGPYNNTYSVQSRFGQVALGPMVLCLLGAFDPFSY